ncbi:MAG: hypothetical protein NZ941_08570 [Candidatus Caldarchaeum sp.]|nr:hypothetical protein [Candidatus Caldarchaeum sp.]
MSHQALDEALRIIDENQRNGSTVRLLGGIAVYYHSPTARQQQFTRDYNDLDFLGLSSQTKTIKSVMKKLEYNAFERFNAIHGSKRLIFFNEAKRIRVDFLLDFFEMCHKLDFRARLGLDPVTLSVSDLLLTKAQIVEITEKDLMDIALLLLDHEVCDRNEHDKINGKYIAQLLANDWGLHKTFNTNMEKVVNWIDEKKLGSQNAAIIRARIAEMKKFVDNEPKTMRWKARSLIGEKIPWYQLPEEPMRDFIQL